VWATFRKLREQNARQGFVEAPQPDALAVTLPDPLGGMARLGFCTGWREGEILARRMAARVVGDRVVPWLFHRQDRRVVDFRKAWATACEAAGCPGLLFHDLRRSFARDAVDDGNDPITVMNIGGWRTASVFARYKIVDTKRMAAALARTQTFRDGQRATGATVIQPAQAAEARR